MPMCVRGTWDDASGTAGLALLVTGVALGGQGPTRQCVADALWMWGSSVWRHREDKPRRVPFAEPGRRRLPVASVVLACWPAVSRLGSVCPGPWDG
jgi:hypothetical protein